MHYLIDGYNLLFEMTEESSGFQKNREFIIRFIHENLHHLNLSATLIFDGANPSPFLDYAYFDHLEIIFTTKGLSADEFIIEKVETIKPVTVITSDNHLQMICRTLGAKIISSNEFIQKINNKNHKQTKKKSHNKPIFQETDAQIERLNRIFETKLKKKQNN